MKYFVVLALLVLACTVATADTFTYSFFGISYDNTAQGGLPSLPQSYSFTVPALWPHATTHVWLHPEMLTSCNTGLSIPCGGVGVQSPGAWDGVVTMSSYEAIDIIACNEPTCSDDLGFFYYFEDGALQTLGEHVTTLYGPYDTFFMPGTGTLTITQNFSSVPEPASMLLLATGVAACFLKGKHL